MKKTIEEQISRLGGVKPIGGQFIQPTEEQIVVIESNLGTRLPDDYRDFLHCYGTSTFQKMVDFKMISELPLFVAPNTEPICHRGGPLGRFFGFSGNVRNLDNNINTMKDRLPENIIPIAVNALGNFICLGIKGKDINKVFYWDHENEWDEEYYLEDYGEPMPPEAKFQNMYLVAHSFEEFILKLEIVPDN